MQVDLAKYKFSDSLPVEMLEAYNTAELSEAPCQLCKEHPELNGRRIHFHGSDVGACPRQTYFKMILGHTTKEVGAKAAFLQDGHLHEAMMLRALSTKFDIYQPKNSDEMRLTVPILTEPADVEKFVDDTSAFSLLINLRTFLIIGHIDGWVVDGDTFHLLECKSVKDYTWKEVKEGKIKDEWYGQVQIYMLMLNIKRAYLLVKNRTTSEMMQPIRIDFDREWVIKKLRMLIQIYKCVNKGIEVPKPETRKATESACKFCEFHSRCYV